MGAPLLEKIFASLPTRDPPTMVGSTRNHQPPEEGDPMMNTFPPGTRVRINGTTTTLFRGKLATVVPSTERPDTPRGYVLIRPDDTTIPTGTADGLLTVFPQSLEVVPHPLASPAPQRHRIYLAVELVVVDDDPKLHATLANLAATAVIDFLPADRIVSSETTARMEVES